jgi:type III pantothenate kinase
VLLAVDVRNTHTFLGLFNGSGDHSKLVQHWRLRTVPDTTADEFQFTLRGLLGAMIANVNGVCVLSTVPSVLREIRIMLGRYYKDVDNVIIERGIRTGISLVVDHPKEVGPDRVVNALSAYDLVGGAAVVVDFGGTATVVDAISDKGQLIGGVLAPGMEVSSAALANTAAALRHVELRCPDRVIGKNTVEAMQSGAIFGFAGLVDALVTRVRAEMGDLDGEIPVVATGATAPLLIPESSTMTMEHYEPHLTLVGLQLAFELNMAARARRAAAAAAAAAAAS